MRAGEAKRSCAIECFEKVEEQSASAAAEREVQWCDGWPILFTKGPELLRAVSELVFWHRRRLRGHVSAPHEAEVGDAPTAQ